MEKALDTLTFLLQILGALVECAKIVVVLVTVVLTTIFFRYLPLRLRRLMPRLAAAAFLFTIAGANFGQTFNLMTLIWSRLSYDIIFVSDGVTYLLILATVKLCCAMVVRKKSSVGITLTMGGVAKKTVERKPSNCYLEITPVLLS